MAAAAALFLFCYAGAIAALVGTWTTNALYSYGFAVPLISAYMVWANSAEWRRHTPVPDYLLGLPAIALGMAMLVAGRLGSLDTVQAVSIIVTLTGLVLVLFGRRTMRLLWFPLAYLLLGVPVWDRAINGLQVPSQMLSGQIAVGLLHAIGVPAVQEGTSIGLPRVTLNVLRECSGVNQLIAVTAMALPAAYLFLRGAVRRVALVVVAVTVAYLSNGFRIALVGFLGDKGFNRGDLLHLVEGLATSVLSYVVIFAVLSVLAKKGKSSGPDKTRPVLATGSVEPRVRLEYVVLALLLGTGGYLFGFHAADVPLRNQLRSLPDRIDDWTVDRAAEPPSRSSWHTPADAQGNRMTTAKVEEMVGRGDVVAFSDVDDELVRTYRNGSGERVRLYIGYYRSQHEGKQLFGGENSALRAASSTTNIDVEPHAIEINQVEQRRAGTSRGLLFWYDLNGRVLANMYRAKGYAIWDALTRRRSNGAVVMVAWDGPAEDDSVGSREQAIEFVRALLPLLPRFIPS